MNYSRFSKSTLVDPPKIDEEEIDYHPVDDAPPKEPKLAVVSGASKLNVRDVGSKESMVLCVVNAGDQLLVEEYIGEWAHVYTSSGIEGYVMREYIKED